jgi:signal transduction histidine kinase
MDAVEAADARRYFRLRRGWPHAVTASLSVPAIWPNGPRAPRENLVAELLENATSFSPPDTPVQVSARWQPDGLSVEIEDHGLGMTPAALAEVNRDLAEPPDFDPANSARLGLFVVGQLASHRGIRVGLRPSSSGGVTAVVTLPSALVETMSSPDPATTRPAARHRVPAG